MAEVISFRDDLTKLINRHSKENGSDTPDFILAGYIESCLATYDATVVARDQWLGRPVGKGRAIDPNHGTDPLTSDEFVRLAGRFPMRGTP
jgi:hypothetical protein